jgi:DnaJ like chaperone protein
MGLFNALRRLVAGKATPPPCGGVVATPCAPDGDPHFSAAVTALGAKLARADGRADSVEFDSFVEMFPPEPAAGNDVGRLYRLARQTPLGFESYAKRLGKRYRNCPKLLESVVDRLFHVARADGVVTGDEVAYLERVAELFGLSPLNFRRLKDEHLGGGPDDPYGVIGVPADASDDIVRGAWRKALSQHHPDRAAAAGLPREAVEAAGVAAAAINAAYDQILRERRAIAA